MDPTPFGVLGGAVIGSGVYLAVRGVALLWQRRVARGLAYLAALLACLLGGVGIPALAVVLALHFDLESDPSQKARLLAEGISVALNCGLTFGLLAIVLATVLPRWNARRPVRPP